MLKTQNDGVLTITVIYGIKNNQLLLRLHLQKEPIEEIEHIVKIVIKNYLLIYRC